LCRGGAGGTCSADLAFERLGGDHFGSFTKPPAGIQRIVYSIAVALPPTAAFFGPKPTANSLDLHAQLPRDPEQKWPNSWTKMAAPNNTSTGGNHVNEHLKCHAKNSAPYRKGRLDYIMETSTREDQMQQAEPARETLHRATLFTRSGL